MSVQSTRSTPQGASYGNTACEDIPFTRLSLVELRKLTDTRVSRWLLIAIAAATPIVIAVMLVVAAPSNLTYDKLVDYAQTPHPGHPGAFIGSWIQLVAVVVAVAAGIAA
jgi:hypothetical protein